MSLADAKSTVDTWLALPQSRILIPGPNHYAKVMALMEDSHSVGRVLSDAVLAAYAIENRATLYSNDSDSARFDGLSWVNPL